MSSSNGIIIILSYPDTVVRPAYWEPSSKIWPKLGIGSKHAVQAGHAALLLLKKGKTKINYYDFGRYITTYGNGRVRCKETDAELEIPIKAEFEKEELINLQEILLWLEKHPEKTHGDGRLIASINTDINYNLASQFINSFIQRKEIPYGVFVKNGSNCSRFVTDTLIASLTNKKIKLQLKTSNLVTPSPIGNVIKATSTKTIYNVYQQEIKLYKNRSILKEYKDSFLNKFDIEPNLIGTEKPNKAIFELENGTWLGGIGSGAWFHIEKQIDNKNYLIARYNSTGIKDFEGEFTINNDSFSTDGKCEFLHPTNCQEMFVIQNGEAFIFTIKK
ncbi:hypothetical protein BW723_10700 [Polaribacter reichenbachii]|uniref:Uncharacterized protein n=1 Tax=Polaribacter reichenbachii TaxID=996801 RepID=A0A1B8TQ43_9FLAO|nr:DUF6695 family protein [Polaribacter reichenbachii]APZ46722.1 hypothetical protein BW723_10700 [Polaribacter reichenbachii]AUC17365.1 hypothetical protein BTO17_01145 [Polaribacter reichenbachii]OBY61759.1 hypothetical protein LPB301_17055 [Polaribacter reichenbachii]